MAAWPRTLELRPTGRPTLDHPAGDCKRGCRPRPRRRVSPGAERTCCAAMCVGFSEPPSSLGPNGLASARPRPIARVREVVAGHPRVRAVTQPFVDHVLAEQRGALPEPG